MYKISLTVRNEGFLSSAVSEKAVEKGVVNPVEVKLELDEEVELLIGKPRTKVGHLEGRSKYLRHGFWAVVEGENPNDNEAHLEWLVRGPIGKQVKVVAKGGRAGTCRLALQLTKT